MLDSAYKTITLLMLGVLLGHTLGASANTATKLNDIQFKLEQLQKEVRKP